MTVIHPTMLRPLKTGLAGLLVAMLAGSALNAAIAPRRMVIMPLKLELPAIPLTFSMPHYPERTVEWKTGAGGGFCGGVQPRWYLHGCGGMAGLLKLPERESRLADPLAVLGGAYLKCRAIRVSLLATAVHVVDYPDGYFGDWVQDGFLVRAREDVSGENRMRDLFLLLAQCVTAPQDTDEYWINETAFDESAADYRHDAGFASEWTIEFVGEAPLRLDLDARGGRLLLEAGDRWDSYELDATRARQLQELLASNRN